MGLQAKMRAITSHALSWIRERNTCEHGFTTAKLQSAELTLKQQVQITVIMKI